MCKQQGRRQNSHSKEPLLRGTRLLSESKRCDGVFDLMENGSLEHHCADGDLLLTSLFAPVTYRSSAAFELACCLTTDSEKVLVALNCSHRRLCCNTVVWARTDIHI